jgi:hypothetical protein
MREAAERMSNYEMILRYLQLPSSILPLAYQIWQIGICLLGKW